MKCYSCPKKPIYFFWIIPPTLMFGFSFVLLAGGLAHLLLWVVGKSSTHMGDFLVGFTSGAAMNLVFGAILNLPTEVCIDTRGFYIRIFTIKQVFVPWENLLDIKISLRFDPNREMVWVVQVERLTFWHRFLGLFHGTGWAPSFIITSDMDGYKELRRTLASHLN